MDNSGLHCKKPLITALKEAGFCIENIKKHGKKTIITVFRHKQPFATETEPATVKGTPFAMALPAIGKTTGKTRI